MPFSLNVRAIAVVASTPDLYERTAAFKPDASASFQSFTSLFHTSAKVAPAASASPILADDDSASTSIPTLIAAVSSPVDKANKSKRVHLLRELVKTERTLAGYLGAVVAVFFPAGESQPSDRSISAGDVAAVMLNIQTVAAVSVKAANLFAAAASPEALEAGADTIGAVVLALLPRLQEAYGVYTVGQQAAFAHHVALCKRSPKTAAILARRWEAVNRLAAPVSHPLSPSAILSMPFQRPTRLMMLLDSLVKETSATHADRVNLERAAAGVRQMCNDIEQAMAEHERVAKEAADAIKRRGWTFRAKVESLLVGGAIRLKSRHRKTTSGVVASAAHLGPSIPTSPTSDAVELPTSPSPSETFVLEDSFELESVSNSDGDDDELPALTRQSSSETMSSAFSVETAASAADNALGLHGISLPVAVARLSLESLVDEPAPVVLSAFEAEVERARKARALALTGSLPGRTSRPKSRRVSPLNPARALPGVDAVNCASSKDFEPTGNAPAAARRRRI